MSFEFKFSSKFINLTQDEIDEAYLIVSTEYAGVLTLWEKLSTELRDLKRTTCMNYLVAWKLADLNPLRVKNIDADGRPLSSKSIGGTALSFNNGNSQDALLPLTSNTFGRMAKSMIESCPERMGVLG